jgi:hypothetical protein
MVERKTPAIDAIEHDGSTPATKRVLMYGWDGSNKVRLKTDSEGALGISATLTGADGAIVDGSNSSLRASVLNYAASKPLAVRLTDTDGNYVAPASGSSIYALPGGTYDVQATDLDIRNLVFATDKVDVSGSSIIAFQGGSWTVGLPANAATETTLSSLRASLLDVATQTTLSAINAKLVTGTDIGDVTINNSTGAAAVNIQDGGNTITVDGTVTANVSGGSLRAFIDVTPGGIWSAYSNASLINTAALVKGASGAFGGYYVYNPNSTAVYLQVFNQVSASSVTVGTTTPDYFFGIPATAGANLEFTQGVAHTNGIVIAATGGATNSSLMSLPIQASVFYK